ncbi:hypothetical protein FQR65_LT00178 [Abscondita terminalis]|nr:hypothetical protein FQR65_LT00178 [Abscondita terminalis]
MASRDTNFSNGIYELITSITGFKEGSKEFEKAFDNVSPRLQNYNTAYVPTKKEIDSVIVSLGEKFAFHGYIRQKKELHDQYEILASSNKLSVIKLLIELAESPTNNVTKYVPMFQRKNEELIDWGRYLREGIERWTPPPSDSSESDEDSFIVDVLDDGNGGCWAEVQPKSLYDSGEECGNQRIMKAEAEYALRSTVQSGWFTKKKFVMQPQSETEAGNFAFLWQKHVDTITRGLIETESPSIITEYHVLREIIWQMFSQHTSVCYHIVGDKIEPANVTVSSVRQPILESFLREFIPYMDYFQELRKFRVSLSLLNKSVICDTYWSYNCGVEMIMKPMIDLLGDIEEKVLKQEEIYTLLELAKQLRPILPALEILNDIQKVAILDPSVHSPLMCATTLLCTLYKRLFNTKTKAEQDLYLMLYLHSVYRYFQIMDSWLGSGKLIDCVGEFIITDNRLKDFDVDVGEDPILDLICTQVLQIGQNITMLRQLGKTKLFFDYIGITKETLYDAFVRKVLEKIAAFFDVPTEEASESAEDEEEPSEFMFAGVNSDDCKYFTEMDKLENLVDTSNVFLMKAFEPYFVNKPAKKVVPEVSLYRRIQKLTKAYLPIHSVITGAFTELLDERYSALSVMVKNVLVENHNLEENFEFLQHVFLFKEDMIFPFYRHLFDGMESITFLGNHAWLSSFLQDLIVDAYPKLYNKASVELREDWRQADDPLEICGLINIKYRNEWPTNIIVLDEHIPMYKALFQFILKVKWALYTLNHMYFTDIEPKSRAIVSKNVDVTLTKLKMLRFGLINIFNTIQHYILGHVFSELSLRFFQEREDACNLETLVKAHKSFILSIHKACLDFQECERTGFSFTLILNLVRDLRLTWRKVDRVPYDVLCAWEKSYWLCHKKLDEIIYTSRIVRDL